MGGRAWIKASTGTASDWEPFEDGERGIKPTTGTTNDWSQDGEYYILVERVENPPGVFTPVWEHIITREPQNLPQGISLGRGPEVIGPSNHVCGWTVPNADTPEAGYTMRVEWYVNGGLDAVDTPAASAGSVQRAYNAEDDVFCRLSFVNSVGQGPEAQTNTV